MYLNESLRAVICRFVNFDDNISEPKRCLPPPPPSPSPLRPSPRTWPVSSKAYSHRKSTSFALQSPKLKTYKEPKNRFQGPNSARLCSLMGRYDNPRLTQFLATIEFKNSTTGEIC